MTAWSSIVRGCFPAYQHSPPREFCRSIRASRPWPQPPEWQRIPSMPAPHSRRILTRRLNRHAPPYLEEPALDAGTC